MNRRSHSGSTPRTRFPGGHRQRHQGGRHVPSGATLSHDIRRCEEPRDQGAGSRHHRRGGEVNYEKRMGAQWTADLRPLRTNKGVLVRGPALVLCSNRLMGSPATAGKRSTTTTKSCSISAGLFLAAVHNTGLVTHLNPLNCGPALECCWTDPRMKSFDVAAHGIPGSRRHSFPPLHRKPLEEISARFGLKLCGMRKTWSKLHYVSLISAIQPLKVPYEGSRTISLHP